MFLLARSVRTFGTEEKETGRYRRCLSMLRRISIRQATAYLFYLVTNASLFNLTKVCLPAMHLQHAHERDHRAFPSVLPCATCRKSLTKSARDYDRDVLDCKAESWFGGSDSEAVPLCLA